MEAHGSIELSEVALKKLTVPQLKSMCKERRIVGYSKLTKDRIVQKLLDNLATLRSTAQSCPAPVGINDNLALHLTSGNQRPATRIEESPHDIPAKPSMEQGQGCLNQTPEVEMAPFSRSPTAYLDASPSADGTTLIDIHPNCIAGSSKRSGAETQIFPMPKKSRTDTPLSATRDEGTVPGALFTRQKFGPKRQEYGHAAIASQNIAQGESVQAGTRPFSNRKFKVLKPFPRVDSLAKASAILPSKNIPTGAGSTKNVDNDKKLLRDEDLPSHLEHLNFPPEEKFLSTAIQLPPSVAQRKHIPNLSLILSRISYEELKSCALVSRAFRYAAYLSAFHRLSRKFPGKRLEDILRQHPSNMANLWPYLRLREREVDTRRSIYERSFLSKALLGKAEVDQRLWFSPNHERQISVALRFLTTKLFFLISTGLGMDHYNSSKTPGRVVDAEEVVENEVWKITYCSSSSVQTFYVLEVTCEVIGESECSSDKPMAPTGLREDWATYIGTAFVDPNGLQRNGLLEHLRWSNHEEYEKGISKVWLKKIEPEGKVGLAKWTIAMRYVFACVVANSVSGPWRSANKMAQDFEGQVSANMARNEKIKGLSLFLPMHHHVESVHFTSANRLALHEALAVVQTPVREYFILRDNGMQVGCEEEGVALVWMKTLGCSTNGCVESS